MPNFILLLLILFNATGCQILSLGSNFSNPQSPRYASDFAAQSPTANSAIVKIVSFNIKYSRKIDKAIHTLKNSALSDADLILLQEMNHEGVEKIANALQYNYVYYPAVYHPISRSEFGNAVMSRWPIIDDEKLILSKYGIDRRQRIAVRATVQIDDKKINVYSIHMDIFLDPERKTYQIKRLLYSLPPSEEYYIIAGDFNTFTNSSRRAILKPMELNGFVLANGNVLWTYKQKLLFNKKSLLDQIYVKGFDVIEAGRLEDKTASDHFPVWAYVKFR